MGRQRKGICEAGDVARFVKCLPCKLNLHSVLRTHIKMLGTVVLERDIQPGQPTGEHQANHRGFLKESAVADCRGAEVPLSPPKAHAGTRVWICICAHTNTNVHLNTHRHAHMRLFIHI